MTFKHMKFEDSATMRALEKLAIKKGMFKPSSEENRIAKIAANINKTSDSLAENLMTLCFKLRANGFSKQAYELEVKFINYKQAETGLYDVTKETGEDLIDFAHPDGSKKLDKNWDELGTVETLVDQHSKILDVVNKLPKGKLANKQAINAIKILTANFQGEDSLDAFYNQATELFNKFKSVYTVVRNKLNYSNFDDMLLNGIQKILDSKGIYNVDDEFMNIERAVNDLKEELSPSWYSSLETKNKWKDEIEPMFNLLSKYVVPFNSIIQKIRKTESDAKKSSLKQYDPENKPAPAAPSPNPAADPSAKILQEYGLAFKAANKYKELVEIKKLANAQELKDWLDKAIGLISANMDKLQKSPNKNDPEVIAAYEQQLQSISGKLDAFKLKWMA